jgi:hypothetical protein
MNTKTEDKMTLLEKAHAAPNRDQRLEAPAELIELALAWARDEISLAQATVALKGTRGKMTGYVGLARGLREAVRKGILK